MPVFEGGICMRAPLRLAALAAAIIGCIPFGAHAQLELGGTTNSRDLGIMVPSVTLNPNTGGAQANFYVRGLPGVGLYVDGVWQDGFGFQQMNFAEMERVEVLRGPQGTLFGRNTNGGAVNMTTRKPADEFGARDAAYQRTQIDPATGKPVLEPAYGILNARFVYEPAMRNYSVELWGKNLLDELYVNGGFDTRDTWGYDFSVVGRSRQVGVGLNFKF